MRRGELARIAPGVYTDRVDDPSAAVAAEWWTIVGHMIPGAVITDRSAPVGGPVDGVLYVAHPVRRRDIELPGLLVRSRVGPGPLDGDVARPGGIYQASTGRGLLDNTLASRAAKGRASRTLSRTELGDWVDRILRVQGDRRLRDYRAEAVELAPQLNVSADRLDLLVSLMGAALGTREVPDVGSSPLAARQSGRAYDPDRLALLELLVEALRAAAPQSRPAEPLDPRLAFLPFYEAYFSNYIEGTEFPLDTAERIVYENEVPPTRPADAHDLTGTYEIVNDVAEMSSLATDQDRFLDVLRHRHGTVMAGRPETRPGEFKTLVNQAGNTEFVARDLVEGTLRAGFDRLSLLDTAWERAVYMTFLISEVHPFNDGNGRTARIMMNAELVGRGQARIIIPTVYRDDYLGALRRLSRDNDPTVLIKALRYAHDYTAGIDFSTLSVARDHLAATNAFEEPDSDRRLVLPAQTRRPAQTPPRPSLEAGAALRLARPSRTARAIGRAPDVER